jgi:hypothetical protein
MELDAPVGLLEVLVEAVALGDEVLLCGLNDVSERSPTDNRCCELC